MSEKEMITTSEDASDAPKSKNQLKNEQKRLEKLAKFQAKQDKLTKETKEGDKVAKPKTLHIKTEAFVNTTLPGEKKGTVGIVPLDSHTH